jgi:hypothetical protein
MGEVFTPHDRARLDIRYFALVLPLAYVRGERLDRGRQPAAL